MSSDGLPRFAGLNQAYQHFSRAKEAHTLSLMGVIISLQIGLIKKRMRLEISCADRLGITQDILDILVSKDIDLRGIEIAAGGRIFLNFPTIEFADFQHLMPKIRRLEGIDDVKTTPFMPMEREQNQIRALLQTLPDPVFSLDTKGCIVLANDVALTSLAMTFTQLQGMEIGELIKGFNFHRWFDSKDMQGYSQRVKFIEQDFVADILPIMVPDNENASIRAGAVLLLKSEFRLGQQLTALHQQTEDSFTAIQADSTQMKQLLREAKRMAELDAPMLILGETGTGKERIAKACHQASRRGDKPFLLFNCAALTDKQAAAELFGDGADSAKPNNKKVGLLQLAQGGTVLLDNVHALPLSLQARLLYVLQAGAYCPLEAQSGDSPQVKVDVRIVCTSDKDLALLAEQGAFRPDLYYRLNVLSLVMPPLRHRAADIIALAETFVKQHSLKLGRRPPTLTRSCLAHISSYTWPGNVRQMENAIYRALSLLQGHELDWEDMQLPSPNTAVSHIDESFTGSLEQAVKNFEKDLLGKLYPYYPSSRQLAKKLGLSHTAVANKLRDYGITKKI